MSKGVEIGLSLEGDEALIKALESFGEGALKEALKQLYREGEEIMTLAKEQYVPVDLGVLRASGHVVIPDGSKDTVELGFGGPAGIGNQGETNDEGVGYAVIVHEDLSAHHEVGQAKYLEVPLMERSKGMAERIAKRMQKVRV